MSIKVGLDDLATTLQDYAYAYLLTGGADGRPHAVAVTPELVGGRLRIAEPGRRTRANAVERAAVALVYPPTEPGGYSLIVDGDATADGDALTVSVTSAVLHRAATPGSEPSATGCASDCAHIPVVEERTQ